LLEKWKNERAEARQAIRQLRQEPHPSGARHLRDHVDLYRIWIAGRWRLAYQIDDEQQRIRSLRVRKKDDVDYDSLAASES
jgi:mRNA-degrading endonuclease RelE of RelBE toxin-antitoxin system